MASTSLLMFDTENLSTVTNIYRIIVDAKGTHIIPETVYND